MNRWVCKEEIKMTKTMKLNELVEHLNSRNEASIAAETVINYNKILIGEEICMGGEDTMTGDWEKDARTVGYRRENLEKSLNEIRDKVIGRYESFRPLIDDDNGRADSRKINSFIRKLIGSHPDAKTFSGDKRKFLEKFLYCAVLAPSYRSIFHYENMCEEYLISGSFMEIIRASKDYLFEVKEDEWQKLVEEEEYDNLYREYASGFRAYMNQIYSILTNGSTWDFYGEKEIQEASSVRSEVIGPSEVHLIHIDVDEFVESDDVISLPPPDFDARRKEYEYYDEVCGNALKEYMDHLPKTNHLAKYYRELRETVKGMDTSDLPSLIEVMVDNYLIENRIAPICFSKGYGLIDNGLTRAVKTVNDSIDRARKYK